MNDFYQHCLLEINFFSYGHNTFCSLKERFSYAALLLCLNQIKFNAFRETNNKCNGSHPFIIFGYPLKCLFNPIWHAYSFQMRKSVWIKHCYHGDYVFYSKTDGLSYTVKLKPKRYINLCIFLLSHRRCHSSSKQTKSNKAKMCFVCGGIGVGG